MESDSLPAVDLDALTAILGDDDNMVSEAEEDLWAFKLELPTPPLSPDSSHAATSCGLDEEIIDDGEVEQGEDKTTEAESECTFVDWTSDCESDSEFGVFRNPYLRRDSKHDCMWSGSCADSAQCFRRTSQLPTVAALPTPDYLMPKSEPAAWCASSSSSARGRPRRTRSVSESSYSSSCSSSDSSASDRSYVPPSLWSAENNRHHHQQQQQCVGVGGGDHVTPAPYPHSDHSYHVGCQEGGPPRDSLGIQTPSDSEEEIDVVTLPGKRIKTEPSKPSHKRTGVSPSLPYERQLQLAVAQCAQRQRPAKAPTVSENKSGQEGFRRRRRRNPGLRLTLKRVRPLTRRKVKEAVDDKQSLQSHYHVTTTPSKPFVTRSVVLQSSGSPGHLRLTSQDASCGSSSAGSEEDTGRRKEHNDMERKRRNDLKGSFQILRRQVPELAHNERAPKVQILTRASNYIAQLVTTEKRLMSAKDAQEHRNAQLRRQLSALQRKRSYAN